MRIQEMILTKTLQHKSSYKVLMTNLIFYLVIKLHVVLETKKTETILKFKNMGRLVETSRNYHELIDCKERAVKILRSLNLQGILKNLKKSILSKKSKLLLVSDPQVKTIQADKSRVRQ